MGLRIRTNIQSLNAQRHMEGSTQNVGRITQRLASGNRINRGADDAAGFAISEVLRADVRSLNQARRNANDGISLIEVAEGGLHEVNNILVRIKELSIQAASDTIGNRERQYLNQEFSALLDEADRIAINTEFNGSRLLVGKAELPTELKGEQLVVPLEIQVGKDYYIEADSIEAPNPINIIRLDFTRFNAFTSGEGSLHVRATESGDENRIDSKEDAQRTINRVDVAMEAIASYRADLGAIQNRLEKTQKSIGIHVENISHAKSRIKDADFAAETAKLTQQTILQQAGASVLAQANAQPQIALKLLT